MVSKTSQNPLTESRVNSSQPSLHDYCLYSRGTILTFLGDAPQFIPAKISIIVTCSLTVVLALILRLYYVRLNKKRQAMVDSGEVTVNGDAWLMDMTDKENVGFRYST
jgi:hypothetical protein